MRFYSLPADKVVDILKSNSRLGLSNTAVKDRIKKFGYNKLKEPKKKNLFLRFIDQLSDFMILILIIAAVVSFIISKLENNNDYIDSIIIILIVIINACVGVVQENKAEKAIEALKKLSSYKTNVLRNGKEAVIDSEMLVPGDIVYLNTGDFVPADARIISANNLKVKEDALTGESVAAIKDANVCLKEGTNIIDQKNMLFSGTFVTTGKCTCIVTATGMNTQIGKIANLINKQDSPCTPLQKSLHKTGKLLGLSAIIICIIIFALGLLQNIDPLKMFMISISLAVAAIPEGLPAVVTIVLALGVKRLADNKAIIRKLPAVETLGSADVICSDKTGTLTQNKMTVQIVSDFKDILKPSSNSTEIILSLATLCNNAKTIRSNNKIYALGDPTEEAIVNAYNSLGKDKKVLDDLFVRIDEIPFDSNKKFMTTLHKTPTGKYRIISKGAADILINKCTKFLNNGKISDITNFERQLIRKQNEAMASKALRVICVCYNDTNTLPSKDQLNKNLIFAGLIAMLDPPRKEAKQAVKDCQLAGIKPIMITGDHIITAKAIAKDLGIYTTDSKAICGYELDRISPENLKDKINDYSVFARVTPEHKVKIVKAFQQNNNVVAMTGDGVNDAPALKAADIGCAMGKNGTAVAKEAADMILTDDNFATIVSAIKQGRTVFENIRKTIHFLISSNIGEIITVLSAFLLNLPSPLLAIQLLWVNLVTDSLPALALGVEPVEKNIMLKKSKNEKGKLFTKKMAFEIAVEGFFIGTISMLAFCIGRSYFDSFDNTDIARTMAFCVLSLSQLIHAFNVRSDLSLFKIGFFSNPKMIFSFFVCLLLQISVVCIPFLNSVFKTVPLNPVQWLIVAGLSLSPLVIIEIEKALFKKPCHDS